MVIYRNHLRIAVTVNIFEKMKMRNKILKLLFVSVLIIAVSVILYKDKFSNKIMPLVVETNKGNIQLDLDGDGSSEYLVMKLPSGTESNKIESLAAYNASGQEIGKLPADMPINIHAKKSLKKYRAGSDSKKEIFSMDFFVGPHQMETMFFGLTKNLLLPICFVGQPTGPYDCL